MQNIFKNHNLKHIKDSEDKITAKMTQNWIPQTSHDLDGALLNERL